MTAHPYQITAPAVMTVKGDGSSGTFQVTNSGTKPLQVTESFGRDTVAAVQYPAASHATARTFSDPWCRISPTTFKLAAGASQAVHIACTVPAGTAGTHYLSAALLAAPVAHQGGGLVVLGAVASQIEIPEPGIAVPVTTHGLPHAVALPSQGGTSPVLLAGLSASFLVLVVLVLLALRLIGRRLSR